VSFGTTRRGLEPETVHRYLAEVADTVERLTTELALTSAELEEARTAEASLHRTVVAMSEAREQIMEAARADAHRMTTQADRGATLAMVRAEEDATGIVMEARRAALDVIAEARRDADRLLQTANAAAAPLSRKIEQLRAVVRRTENLMRGLASGALGDLAQAHLMLDEAPIDPAPEMQIVFTDAEDADGDDHGSVQPLPEAVDRLLSHLREIG
jgi:cell division septum initiation protein DivIVA